MRLLGSYGISKMLEMSRLIRGGGAEGGGVNEVGVLGRTLVRGALMFTALFPPDGGGDGSVSTPRPSFFLHSAIAVVPVACTGFLRVILKPPAGTPFVCDCCAPLGTVFLPANSHIPFHKLA